MAVARAAQNASPYLITARTASHTAAAKIHNALAGIDVYVELDQPDGQAAIGHIVEMNTVHYGLTHYNAVAPTRGHAVENRSGKLDAERRRQLQQTDCEVFRTREGQVGPMEQRLNGFPPSSA
ncbi:hypothetical protein T492DRAFT_886290 [Pavlovales sp. CCMP2436]|nr:hypothetical protein T492DRAFT_886290 [Pavlovales sp. CCMP2436]